MDSVESKCSNPIAPELHQQLIGLAFKIAYNCKCDLDYSHESILLVEKIICDVHKEYIKTKDETGLNGIAVEFAAYIIATITKNTNDGKWYMDHLDFGKKSFPFYWKKSVLFPYGWCQKRIFDGEVDNIWTKYKLFVLENA